MAVGDTFNTREPIGPIDFTPELARAGVKLISNNATTDVAFEGRLGEVLVTGEGNNGKTAPMSAEAMRTSPPPNMLPVPPEDDNLTPPGVLAPSEIKQQGSLLSKLGDFLSDPASVKLLANLGIAIGNGTNAGRGIGDFAIANAEQRAQQDFRTQLEGGKNPGDILVSGLSGEGRKSVLEEFNAGREAERNRLRQDQSDQLTKRATEADIANTESQIQDREADNARADNETQLEARRVAVAEGALALEQQTAPVLNALRVAQTEGEKARTTNANAPTSDEGIKRAGEAIKLANSYDDTILQTQEIVSKLQSQLNLAENDEKRDAINRQITATQADLRKYRRQQDRLKSGAADMLGLSVQELPNGPNPPPSFKSVEEAQASGKKGLVSINGRMAIID